MAMKIKKLYPDDEDIGKDFDMLILLDDFQKEVIVGLAKETKKWVKNRANT